jgi:hypothetical protein
MKDKNKCCTYDDACTYAQKATILVQQDAKVQHSMFFCMVLMLSLNKLTTSA